MKNKCYLCRSTDINGGKVDISISLHGTEEEQTLWFCQNCMSKIPKSRSLDIITHILKKKKELDECEFTCKSCGKKIPVNQHPRKLNIFWDVYSHYHDKDFNECFNYTLCPSCTKKAQQVLDSCNQDYCIPQLCVKMGVPLPYGYDATNIRAELK